MAAEREVREVAGPGQRLSDRRVRRAALGADGRAREPDLRSALRGGLGRHPAALAARPIRRTSPTCASSTPTAARRSCRATAPARRSSTCAARAGPTPTSSRSAPPPGRSRPTIADERTCTLAMGRASATSKDYPGRPGGRPGGAGGRRSQLALPARLDRQPAVRDRGRRTASSELDLPAIGPEIESHELFPNRTNVSFYRVEESAGEGSRVRARIFERGVGETLSSGTGASGAAVAAVLAGAREPRDRGRARRRRARRSRSAPTWKCA